MAEAEKGWQDESNAKMRELEHKTKGLVGKDVRGKPLVGKVSRLSKQATKVNLAFEKTPLWDEKDLVEEIYQDYLVNTGNIVDEKQRPTFNTYLIDQVLPALTARYNDLLNSALHHELAFDKNKDIAPLTRVEVEKIREILDKTGEAVFKYLRNHGYTNTHTAQAKWKAARDWMKETLAVLPSGEGFYNK